MSNNNQERDTEISPTLVRAQRDIIILVSDKQRQEFQSFVDRANKISLDGKHIR